MAHSIKRDSLNENPTTENLHNEILMTSTPKKSLPGQLRTNSVCGEIAKASTSETSLSDELVFEQISSWAFDITSEEHVTRDQPNQVLNDYEDSTAYLQKLEEIWHTLKNDMNKLVNAARTRQRIDSFDPDSIAASRMNQSYIREKLQERTKMINKVNRLRKKVLEIKRIKQEEILNFQKENLEKSLNLLVDQECLLNQLEQPDKYNQSASGSDAAQEPELSKIMSKIEEQVECQQNVLGVARAIVLTLEDKLQQKDKEIAELRARSGLSTIPSNAINQTYGIPILTLNEFENTLFGLRADVKTAVENEEDLEREMKEKEKRYEFFMNGLKKEYNNLHVFLETSASNATPHEIHKMFLKTVRQMRLVLDFVNPPTTSDRQIEMLKELSETFLSTNPDERNKIFEAIDDETIRSEILEMMNEMHGAFRPSLSILQTDDGKESEDEKSRGVLNLKKHKLARLHDNMKSCLPGQANCDEDSKEQSPETSSGVGASASFCLGDTVAKSDDDSDDDGRRSPRQKSCEDLRTLVSGGMISDIKSGLLKAVAEEHINHERHNHNHTNESLFENTSDYFY